LISQQSGKKVKTTCSTCGEIELKSANNLTNHNRKYNGNGCMVCSGQRIRLGYNDFWTVQNDICLKLNIPKEEAQRVTRWSGNRLSCSCSLCGREWKPTANTLSTGHACGCEVVSKGAQALKELLESHNIKFKQEWRNEQVKNILTLPIDFMILDEDENPLLAIEWHGRQHYEPVELWGGIPKLVEQQKRDAAKAECLAKLSIPLLVVDGRAFAKNMTSVKWKKPVLKWLKSLGLIHKPLKTSDL
jgi:Protein of unknown function (DUF2726)